MSAQHGPAQLLSALRDAIQDCKCSMAQRDSGHLVDCFVPAAKDAIAKAEGRQ